MGYPWFIPTRGYPPRPDYGGIAVLATLVGFLVLTSYWVEIGGAWRSWSTPPPPPQPRIVYIERERPSDWPPKFDPLPLHDPLTKHDVETAVQNAIERDRMMRGKAPY